MSEKLARKVVYFGKRDADLWDAVEKLPKGDQNYHMKQALREYFLEGVRHHSPMSRVPQEAAPVTPSPSDPTDSIDIDMIKTLMR